MKKKSSVKMIFSRSFFFGRTAPFTRPPSRDRPSAAGPASSLEGRQRVRPAGAGRRPGGSVLPDLLALSVLFRVASEIVFSAFLR